MSFSRKWYQKQVRALNLSLSIIASFEIDLSSNEFASQPKKNGLLGNPGVQKEKSDCQRGISGTRLSTQSYMNLTWINAHKDCFSCLWNYHRVAGRHSWCPKPQLHQLARFLPTTRVSEAKRVSYTGAGQGTGSKEYGQSGSHENLTPHESQYNYPTGCGLLIFLFIRILKRQTLWPWSKTKLRLRVFYSRQNTIST